MTVVEYGLRPLAKERPRSTSTGQVYTPKRTRDFEREVRNGWPHEMLEGPVQVNILLRSDSFDVEVKPSELVRPKRLLGDLDNYTKAILDGLNRKAFQDDRLVVDLAVWFEG